MPKEKFTYDNIYQDFSPFKIEIFSVNDTVYDERGLNRKGKIKATWTDQRTARELLWIEWEDKTTEVVNSIHVRKDKEKLPHSVPAGEKKEPLYNEKSPAYQDREPESIEKLRVKVPETKDLTQHVASISMITGEGEDEVEKFMIDSDIRIGTGKYIIVNNNKQIHYKYGSYRFFIENKEVRPREFFTVFPEEKKIQRYGDEHYILVWGSKYLLNKDELLQFLTEYKYPVGKVLAALEEDNEVSII